jgi:hypothetical protein
MAYNSFEENLAEQSYALAEEIRAGKWNKTPGVERPASSPDILRELRRRCPGFTDEQYAQAIAKGLLNSR